MSADSLDHRQRVIFVGLKKMSNDRNVIIDGFQYWMTNHSSETFDVNTCTAYLVNYLGLDSAQKKSLMIGLHIASNKLTEDLPPVPKALLDHLDNHVTTTKESIAKEQDNNSSANEVRENLPPHCEVTSAYLQTLTQLLYKNDSEAFREIKSIVNEDEIESITDILQQQIRAWANRGFSDLTISREISEEDCKNIAHEFYLIVSEVIGPIEADGLVDATMSHVKKLDACSRFHPRLLI